jgi:pilus assembly protein CpaF
VTAAGLAADPETAAMVRVVVHVQEPGAPRRAVFVRRLPAMVGTDPVCDVVLSAPGVRGHHIELDVEGRQLVVRSGGDGSVSVDGVPIHGRRVAVAGSAAVGVGGAVLRALIATGGELPDVLADRARPSVPREAAPEPVDAPGAVVATEETAKTGSAREVNATIRRAIHRRLLDRLDLVHLDRARMNDHLLRAKVERALVGLVDEARAELPASVDRAALVDELVHEAIGLGPLDALLADPAVTEIMVLDAATIYVERNRRMERTEIAFTDDDAARSVLERIVAPLGRRIDESSPLFDARLADGSRVNAVIRPLALRGTCITIRKFPTRGLTMADLEDFGSVSTAMGRFLRRSVAARKNILISGGTGSGKTTLLNALSGSIRDEERVVTIEDAAELRLQQPHVVQLESRPANMEKAGEISIRDLVRNAMRMRPDRIIVGECRGGEAIDMLQAMNTGHDGSMTTTHANSPHEALKRIEMLAMMSGLDVPSRALREQIGLSIDLVVQQSRLADGTRRVTSIAEVTGVGKDGEVNVREIFGYRRTGTGTGGAVEGEFYATGFLPTFLPDFVRCGLIGDGEPVL